VVELGKSGEIEFGHGVLNVGELSGVRLIRELKKQMKESPEMVIIDSPPGASCPTVASVRNADYCLLVTEPTPFGLYDLSLAVRFLQEMRIPQSVVINRAGLGNDDKLKDFCRREDLPVLAEIPFDRKIAEVYSRGGLIVDQIPEYRIVFQDLAKRILEHK
jgi:MinD superfamily P-loop ATPase